MPTNKELDKVIDKILEAISPKAMARWIGTRIQKARESYVISNRNPTTLKEFMEEVQRYCRHQLAAILGGSEEDDFIRICARQDAFRYLPKGSPNSGDPVYQAHKMVTKGTKGGWKKVLDMMAEGLMTGMIEQHTETVIYETIDKAGLKHREGQIEILRRYQERFPEFLPESYRTDSPDVLYEFANIFRVFMSHARIANEMAQRIRPRVEE